MMRKRDKKNTPNKRNKLKSKEINTLKRKKRQDEKREGPAGAFIFCSAY